MAEINKIEIDGVTYDIGGGSGSTNAKFIGKYYSNDEGMQESNFEDVPLEENKMYLMLYSYDGGTSRSFIFCTKPDDFGEYYLPVGIYARFVPNTLYIGIDQSTVSTYDDYVDIYELPITFSSEGGSNTSNSTTSREVLYLNSEKQDIDLPTYSIDGSTLNLTFLAYNNSYLVADLSYIIQQIGNPQFEGISISFQEMKNTKIKLYFSNDTIDYQGGTLLNVPYTLSDRTRENISSSNGLSNPIYVDNYYSQLIDGSCIEYYTSSGFGKGQIMYLIEFDEISHATIEGIYLNLEL